MNDPELNAGQQAAADGFFNFLFSKHDELCISGPGGVGKTFLMGRLIDRVMPRYQDACKLVGIDPVYTEVMMTATTNKASEVLGIATRRPTSTVQSFLGLRVYDDYRTGKSRLTKNKDAPLHYRKVLFVDESSMMDTVLRQYVLEGMQKSKIVYVGDHCQLPPVGEDLSPIYKENLPFYELTQPMRNCGQPDLMAVCSQLRQTVVTGKFSPIRIVPGVIDHLDPDQMEQEIYHLFLDPDNQCRILCYTNAKVVELNDYIRQMRGLSPGLNVGERVINNSAIINDTVALRVEDEFEVLEKGSPESAYVAPGVHLDFTYCTLRGKHGTFPKVPVPADREHFTELLKYFAKKKIWHTYFLLKNNYADLRPRDAATVHKAQGSTYDTVVVDLDDLSSCWDPNTAARLLYVAFTRAKNRVVLYGDLSKKYGGLTR